MIFKLRRSHILQTNICSVTGHFTSNTIGYILQLPSPFLLTNHSKSPDYYSEGQRISVSLAVSEMIKPTALSKN